MTHQLIPFLKRLRLSGILQTLEARNQQAIDGKWTYVEFLARLLEDEVERRAQKQLALHLNPFWERFCSHTALSLFHNSHPHCEPLLWHPRNFSW